VITGMRASSTFGLFWRLLGLGKRYWFHYILLCVLTTSLALLNVAMAEILKRLADAAVGLNMDLLVQAAWLTVGVLIANLAGSVLNKMLSSSLEYRSTLFIQSRLLDKIVNMKIRDLDKYHSGDLINRLCDSLHQAQHGVNVRAQELLGHLLQIAFVLSYLAILHFWLTFGALILAFFLPLLVNILSGPMRNLYESRQKAIADKEAFLQEVMQGGEVVRSYHLLERMKGRFKQKYDAVLQPHLKLVRYETSVFRSHTLVWMLGVLYAFSCGGYLVSEGRIGVGDVVAFAVAFERFAFPLTGLAGMWTQFQQAIVQARRVFELFDLDEEGRGRLSPPERLSAITFEHVSFSYDDPNPVLDQITLELKPGRPTALVGPSGSGKSTLAGLLLKFYEPTGGSVLVDGHDLREIDIRAWRKRIAYIPQEPVLFSGSFFENIAVGNPDASPDDVRAAAEAAQIHDYIMSTARQYDTAIGEGVLPLSGGEKQRVVIARALLANPDILVFDEPTSALDAENERLIFRELRHLFHDRIVLIITHRLSTVRDMEHIVVLEGGRIVEQGSYDELIGRNGRFQAMVSSGKGEAAS
jgi:ATP-binding cassette subfamily B protein AbcA/BmrA